MKAMLIMALMFVASAASAADCVTNARGKTVCSNGEKAVAVNPNTGTVTTAQKESRWRDYGAEQQWHESRREPQNGKCRGGANESEWRHHYQDCAWR